MPPCASRHIGGIFFFCCGSSFFYIFCNLGCVFYFSLSCLFLFCLFLAAMYATVRDAKDRFGSTLAAGIFFYFFWQIIVNIGMVVGLMPVVGMPLPFISYGGTALVVNCALVGIVLSISMRRFVFKS